MQKSHLMSKSLHVKADMMIHNLKERREGNMILLWVKKPDLEPSLVQNCPLSVLSSLAVLCVRFRSLTFSPSLRVCPLSMLSTISLYPKCRDN